MLSSPGSTRRMSRASSRAGIALRSSSMASLSRLDAESFELLSRAEKARLRWRHLESAFDYDAPPCRLALWLLAAVGRPLVCGAWWIAPRVD